MEVSCHPWRQDMDGVLYKNALVEGQIVWRPVDHPFRHAKVQQLELETRNLNLEVGGEGSRRQCIEAGTCQRLYDSYGSTIRGASKLNRPGCRCQDSSAKVISAVGPVPAVWKMDENGDSR